MNTDDRSGDASPAGGLLEVLSEGSTGWKGEGREESIALEGAGLVVAEVPCGVLGKGARRVKEVPESQGEAPQS